MRDLQSLLRRQQAGCNARPVLDAVEVALAEGAGDVAARADRKMQAGALGVAFRRRTEAGCLPSKAGKAGSRVDLSFISRTRQDASISVGLASRFGPLPRLASAIPIASAPPGSFVPAGKRDGIDVNYHPGAGYAITYIHI
jgi:hypothetical protein